ncbi:MAG: putative permease YjgP/YjgQ family protein [Gemmataceae bacterium]|nr:putative permease YjgP/YjgQ family protein [Gemmataceae bacterium]
MITTLDRMFLISYFRSYAIVWTSLISLYVVLDLFTNIDSFGRDGRGVRGVVEHVVEYYSTQISLIFDRMAEAITLLAAMFSVSWMQRNNELLPQLSAGIPTRRVLRPVLLGATATLVLGPLNQEFVIPRIADQLMTSRDDPGGAKALVLMGAYDPSGVHIEGVAGYRKDRRVLKFYATFPECQPNGELSPSGMVHMMADEAVYIPPGEGEYSGGWLLTHATPATFERDHYPPNLKMIDPGKFFLYTRDVDFDVVSRGATWFMFAPTLKLRELLARPEPRRQSKIAVLFHMRITRPLVGILLVLLGLSVILRNPNRHVFISAGLCLALSACFFLSVLGAKFLGDHGYASPPLAAWLPVILFGPLTLVWFDSIHT